MTCTSPINPSSDCRGSQQITYKRCPCLMAFAPRPFVLHSLHSSAAQHPQSWRSSSLMNAFTRCRKEAEYECLGKGFKPHIAPLDGLLAKLSRRREALTGVPFHAKSPLAAAAKPDALLDSFDDMFAAAAVGRTGAGGDSTRGASGRREAASDGEVERSSSDKDLLLIDDEEEEAGDAQVDDGAGEPVCLSSVSRRDAAQHVCHSVRRHGDCNLKVQCSKHSVAAGLQVEESRAMEHNQVQMKTAHRPRGLQVLPSGRRVLRRR
jgi:hypothetical protein